MSKRYFLFLLMLLGAPGCLAAAAAITSPAPETAISRRAQQLFFTGSGASRYLAYVGTIAGARDIASINIDADQSSFKIADIPLGVERVHVRLWSLMGGSWSSNSYIYNVKSQVYYPQLNGAVNDHDAQLWGGQWTTTVEYTDNIASVNCDEPLAAAVSNCLKILNIRGREDQAYKTMIGNVAEGATMAMINIKLKAWALAEGAYCQIAVKAAQETPQLLTGDYLTHVETFGDKNYKLGGRKIVYMAVPVSLNANGDFSVRIFKEIIGNCEVSLAFNVLGIYK